MLNEGVRFADRIENHFRRKYRNFAFYILHFLRPTYLPSRSRAS